MMRMYAQGSYHQELNCERSISPHIADTDQVSPDMIGTLEGDYVRP
ncbi:hypothetical protein [Xanthomonas citri]